VATKIVDASALGALLFGEPDAESVASSLGKARLAAPGLLWFEITSVCLKKIRMHPQQQQQIASCFNLLEQLRIERLEIVHKEVVLLAQVENLTTHDASYLWLSRRLDAELITLDQRLASAAAMQ